MRPSLRADRLLALLIRFIGLVILLATFVAATASFLYNEAEEADRADRVAMQINMRLRDHVAVLEGVRALYQSDTQSSGPGIRAYLTALQPQVRAPGMEGIGIAVAMRRGTPAAAEAMLRLNYGQDIAVWPATDQPVGFPIVLVEPYTPRRHNALGFDMYSDPVRREAMRRAWHTGRPAASGMVELVQEKDESEKQTGFLIYVPVYASRSQQAGAVGTQQPDVYATAPGARPIEAFVYAPFRTHDLMTAVLGSQLDAISGLEIRAGEGPSAPVLFRHGKMSWDTHKQVLRVADRQWTLRISYGHFLARLGRPLAICLFGFAIAWLATQVHRLQQRRVGAFQALAEERARHAEDRELIMGEMAHRMKNAFARIGALARITLREADSLRDFEAKFDGRLRALSDAKQMLVTGAFDTVDLGHIVRRELDLAGVTADGLSGPAVKLDEEGAQAMALAVHELVTNSIKYGALSGEGALAVDWRSDGDDIELCWIESGLAETPCIDSESFGTRFIRSLIERQLKGSWTREAAPSGLSVVIRWPERSFAPAD
jgi:CHASE1-domain containing sensor protein/two-component sensor histidine kinase